MEESDKHEARITTEESIRVGVKEAERKEELDNVHKEVIDISRNGGLMGEASSE